MHTCGGTVVATGGAAGSGGRTVGSWSRGGGLLVVRGVARGLLLVDGRGRGCCARVATRRRTGRTSTVTAIATLL